MKKSYFLTIICCAFFGLNINAQISYGGQPLSFSIPLSKKLAVFELPSFDYSKMIEEDKQQTKSKPYRYGKTHEVNLSPENSGNWQTLQDGRKIWQLVIRSENAYSLSIISNEFKLNDKVKLFIYTPDRNTLLGSFTSQNNNENKGFSTVPVPGDEIILEINLEADVEYGEFTIKTVVHDYKNVLKAYGDSESCNVNINCTEGANWQDEKRSVVKFTAGGLLCTGALINNTAQDGKPYLLTANHCVGNQTDATGANFWFNYESPGCIATVNPAHQSISSSTLRATGENLDFSLLELSITPPVNYNVYYSGWNRSTSPAANTVCIHHPQGDIKKITVDNNAPVNENYGDIYLPNSHWKILTWDIGTTEGGSSGSPLFDQNHRIVGDLTGGLAHCSNNVDDYFSRFDLSWDYHAVANKQLKVWLDPLNLGAQYLDGLDLNAINDGLDAKVNSVVQPNGTFCGTSAIVPQVIIRNNGTVQLTSLTLNYQVNGGPILSEQWTGSLSTSNSITYDFDEVLLPVGASSFKVYVSDPNGGIDLEHSNDTLTVAFFAEENLNVPQIDGDVMVCTGNLASEFSTQNLGTYFWKVTGGEIINGQGSDNIIVTWAPWGERKVDLNLSNFCNNVDALPLHINVVEHGVNIAIQTGSNGELINLVLENCTGNIVYIKNGLPSNYLYNESLILSEGCYELTILSGGSNIEELLITDFCGQNTLVSSINPGNTFNQQFTIGELGEASEFNIYPNPAMDKLIIEAAYSELYANSRFSISNLRGNVVVPVQDFNKRLEIYVSHLPKGVYVVKIYSPRGNFVRKIVIL